MLVLTNIPSLKFLVLAEKFFYGILPYGFILFVRKIAVCMMRGVAGLRKFIKYGTADMFDDIDIETTTFCNRRCSYCPNSLFDRGLKENEKSQWSKSWSASIRSRRIFSRSAKSVISDIVT